MERLQSILSSQPAKFLVVAVLASFATLQAHIIYADIRSRRNKERLNQELKELYKDDQLGDLSKKGLENVQANGIDEGATVIGKGLAMAANSALSVAGREEELIREQLARNYAFFGEEAMTRIRGARVTVVGCGGVGSWAAIMLARSGVGHLRLIDFDYVTLSSLNRHASATRADVGTPKALSLKKMIASVAPWVEVDAVVELWNVENEKQHKWMDSSDWVVDAIDNITTKVDLLSYAHSHSLHIISSMGAGAKTDPSHIQSADISETVADPLSRAVRRRLRTHATHPVMSGIPVVYSTEVPPGLEKGSNGTKTKGDRLGLLPLPEEEFQKGKVDELAPFADFRVRILPVLGMIPAIFGLHVSTYIVCELGGRKIEEPLAVKGRNKLWEKLVKDLTARETKWKGLEKQERIPITEEEVGYVFEELHRSKSSFPPFATLSKPTLIRWNFDEPLTVVNCVVMSPQEATKHEEGYRQGRKPEDVWGPEITEAVLRRRREAEEWFKAVY